MSLDARDQIVTGDRIACDVDILVPVSTGSIWTIWSHTDRIAVLNLTRRVHLYLPLQHSQYIY